MLYKAAIGYLSMNTSTSLIVSVIVALFLAAWMIAGYIRGFLRVLLTTFFLVITLILSASLAGPAAAFLREHTSVDDKIEQRICKYIDSRLYGEAADDDISDGGSQSEAADNIYTEEISKDDMYARAGSDAADTDAEKSFIDSLALPSFLKTELRENNTIQRYTELGVSTFRAYISSQLSAVILKAICYIILTIAVAVILKIISGALGLINRIPVIGGVNRLLGGFLGLLEGLLILWCICIFIMIFSGTSFGTSCMSVIRSSGLLSVIYDYNLPVNAFKALFRL